MTHIIQHVVRGELAFDIAEQMQCPECTEGCDECNGYGYWWICSTSGHRARPYWWRRLDEYSLAVEAPPPNWPDHYITKKKQEARSTGPSSLLAQLGLSKSTKPFTRRV